MIKSLNINENLEKYIKKNSNICDMFSLSTSKILLIVAVRSFLNKEHEKEFVQFFTHQYHFSRASYTLQA